MYKLVLDLGWGGVVKRGRPAYIQYANLFGWTIGSYVVELAGKVGTDHPSYRQDNGNWAYVG